VYCAGGDCLAGKSENGAGLAPSPLRAEGTPHKNIGGYAIGINALNTNSANTYDLIFI